jgi:hypothetical protein
MHQKSQLYMVQELHACGLTVICQNLGHHTLSPGAFAPYGDLLGGASKGSDILMDPLKSQTLIAEANISSAGRKRGVAGQKSKGRQPVVNTDAYDGGAHIHAVFHDEGKVISLIGGSAHYQPTAMDPDGNWQVGSLVDARWPDDIEIQAIL